jgi:hypothetical protein
MKADSLAVEDWLSEIAADPDEIRKLCQTPQALSNLLEAVDMAKQHFLGAIKVSVRTECDPESEAAWVVVDVAVNQQADVINNYENFIEQWVRATDPETRALIHPTFHFA